MPDSLDAEIDRLYALPLDEFTAARNALAKQSDDPERVKRLKKPTRAAGAINRAARGSRRDVKRLLDAADKLAEAQRKLLEGGDRDALRKASGAERRAVDKLMEAVADEGAGEAMLERARGTLHAVATDPELREQLEAGRVTEDHTAVGLGTFGTEAAPAAKNDGARRKLKAAEAELEEAERRLSRAQDELSEARDRLKRAESAAKRAERERDKAAKERDKLA